MTSVTLGSVADRNNARPCQGNQLAKFSISGVPASGDDESAVRTQRQGGGEPIAERKTGQRGEDFTAAASNHTLIQRRRRVSDEVCRCGAGRGGRATEGE